MHAGHKRTFLTLLLGLTAGIGGESLMFLRRQCDRVEAALRDDFRVVLFLRANLDEGKRKILEEQLRAMPEVGDARGISSSEALERLRRLDPELVESVVLVGDNPLQASYEVRLEGAAFGRLEEWISRAQKLADWADIRYKPAQVEAILQAQFYERFLSLTLSAIACLAGAMALAGILAAGGRHGRGPVGGRRDAPGAVVSALTAAAGAALGGAAVFLLVAPMRHLAPWWAWPATASQAWLLLSAAVGGWVLNGQEV